MINFELAFTEGFLYMHAVVFNHVDIDVAPIAMHRELPTSSARSRRFLLSPFSRARFRRAFSCFLCVSPFFSSILNDMMHSSGILLRAVPCVGMPSISFISWYQFNSQRQQISMRQKYLFFSVELSRGSEASWSGGAHILTYEEDTVEPGWS